MRYNFVRWLNNNISTAIGPSRVNPMTGEILDADIILTDGWIRHYWRQFHEVMPELTMEGFTPETLAWLREHPMWDPRIRLAPPASRDAIAFDLARHAPDPYGGHPMASVDPTLLGDDEFDGLVGRVSQVNGLCRAADCKALDIEMMRFTFDLMADDLKHGSESEPKDDKDKEKPKKDEKETKKEEKPKEEMLDGIPEWFVGPVLAELVAHEVGHTLGLRHNFKGSSIYKMSEINSETLKGKKPFAGSVMDYLPVNMFKHVGEQGDYAMIDIGPYDQWAIEYGYAIVEKPEELKPILARVAEPELRYATDEDTLGPDPFARRYDFGADPVEYAKSQMALVKYHRDRLVERFVKEGESWAKARRGFEMTLAMQSRSLSMMANWVGGAFINRDRKGDQNARLPIQVVSAEDQREALRFVIEGAFRDEAFGLTPELLQRMTSDKWLDEFPSAMADSTWPIHDRVIGIQASVLTMLLNPSTLRRVYDNELLTPSDQDMLTIPELLDTLHSAIWTEIQDPPQGKFTPRKPMISSLRRNLQREYLDRLIDLSMPQGLMGASQKPISNLALTHLRKLRDALAPLIAEERMDAYSQAHLSEAKLRIDKALDATYVYNANQIGRFSFPFFFMQSGGPAGPGPK